MQYMLLICGDADAPATDDVEGATQAWVDEMESRGVRLTGNRLRPVADTTTVRVRSGDVLVTDGPFAEGTEQVGGFDLLECADLDEAIEVASKHPWAKYGGIEVRPLWV